MKSIRKISLILIFVLFAGLINAQTDTTYSIIVAGHAYGAHSGSNLGLHPPFLEKLNQNVDSTIKSVFLTGDIVNHSTVESWQQVENELESFDMNAYYVMGNHDDNSIGHNIFQQKHGGTYYSFQYGNELYIVLNSTESDRSISETQLIFLEDVLSNAAADQKRVFIFFHEVIWNSAEKYRLVRSNSRSRYDLVKEQSNFWEDVFPILTDYSEKEFYLFAGDVGGNPDAISASYDKWGNVTLLTSGMGEVNDENYLKVDIKSDTVEFIIVPLNDEVEMHPITWYNVPVTPTEIKGPSIISSKENEANYHVTPVFNATNYKWGLSNGIQGQSDSSSILIEFESFFESGNISVSLVNDGFGESETVRLEIKLDDQTAVTDRNLKTKFWVHQNDELVSIVYKSKKRNIGTIQVYNSAGVQLLTKKIDLSLGKNLFDINKNQLEEGILIFQVLVGNERHIQKKFINF